MTPKTFRTLHLLAAAALLSGLSATAQAQAVINHSKALAGNVTPGDAPGYPVTISRPGHYKLSGNLTVPAGGRGVEITAAHVTLDLNGFTIAGAGQCSYNHTNPSVICNGAHGNGRGIYVSPDGSHAVLRNGTVRGFHEGIFAVASAHLLEMVVSQNSGWGATLSSNADGMPGVERSAFALNGGGGIVFDMGGLVRGVDASYNAGDGIRGASTARTRVVDSAALSNTLQGVRNATVQGIQMYGNAQTSRSGLRSAGGNADEAGVF